MNPGDSVEFQFIERIPVRDQFGMGVRHRSDEKPEDIEIPRCAVGRLVSCPKDDMWVVEFEHTNIQTKVLPWAVRPREGIMFVYTDRRTGDLLHRR